jgi:sugar lactone lactonase YvrE
MDRIDFYMNHLNRYFFILGCLLLVSGCAASSGVEQRYFWPIGGLEPKIEYVGSYVTDQDVKLPESAFTQAVLGVEPGVPIFASPHAVESRGDGVFAVTDSGVATVFVLDLARGEVRKLMNSEGEVFSFAAPMAVVYRPDGGGYVSDASMGVVYRFDAQEIVVQKIGGSDALARPNGLAYDAQRQLLYVADTQNHQIAVFSADGELQRRIGKRGSGEVEFNFPLDIDLAPDGDLVVLDALNARVQVLHPDGSFVRMFGERGTAIGSFMMPKGLAVDGFGHVYVTDGRAHRFIIFDLQGNYLLSIGAHGGAVGGQIAPGMLALPKGVSADPNGEILIVDSLNAMVHRYQFLSDAYLRQKPIREGEHYIPAELR